MMRNLKSLILGPLLALALSLVGGLNLAGPVSAQNLFAPVARVNDAVVSAYELSQRMAFLRLLRAPGDIRALAMEQLVNERLQLAAANHAGIALEENELTEGMSEFAGRANLETEKFLEAIAQGGVAAETFRDFVKAGLIWRNFARARFDRRITITEIEIDRAVAKALPTGGVRLLMSEIVLPASDDQARKASTQRASDLGSISSLDAFATAARRYSVSGTKGRGGDLGWQNLTGLPPAIAAAVQNLDPGQITGPIETEGGISLFMVRERQEIATPAENARSLDYATFFIPGGRSESALAEAAKIRDNIDVCDDLYGHAESLPNDVLVRAELPIAQVPADIALELSSMDVGEVSTRLTRNNGATLVFLMLCTRSRVAVEDISREAISNQLRNQRLVAMASNYLQDLRAAAHIEILAP